MKILTTTLALLLLSASTSIAQDTAAQVTQTEATSETLEMPDMALYRFRCGNILVSDLNIFSDTEAYTGKQKELTVSCYVIKKDDNILLWDTGLPSGLAENPDGMVSGAFTLKLKETITQQLAKISLTPDQITHIGLSHAHFDHAGNVDMFKNATLIIQQAEYNFLTQTPEDARVHHADPAHLSYFLDEKNKEQLQIINGDANLFGDGSVKAISLPGHTPGQMALKVTLPESGVYILSGDQWHFNENRQHNGVPTFNYNRADTLASSDKLNRIIKNTNATLLIQHELADEEKTPALPAYLK